MALERFRSIVVVAAYALSVPVFLVWPGPAPRGAGGWLVRLVAAFGLPTAALAVILLFRSMGRKGPVRAGFESHRRTYDLILDAAAVFIAALHLTIMAYVLAGRLWLGTFVALLVGGAVAFLGNMLPTVRPGSAVGIRTPWTLRDEGVWRKTHRLGGYLLVLSGLALMAAAVFSFQKTWAVLMADAAAAGLGLPAVSFALWRSRPDPRERNVEETPPPPGPPERGAGPAD